MVAYFPEAPPSPPSSRWQIFELHEAAAYWILDISYHIMYIAYCVLYIGNCILHIAYSLFIFLIEAPQQGDLCSRSPFDVYSNPKSEYWRVIWSLNHAEYKIFNGILQEWSGLLWFNVVLQEWPLPVLQSPWCGLRWVCHEWSITLGHIASYSL